MKTIEERALESLRKVRKEECEFNHSAHGALMLPDTTYVGGYIQGANEQHKIDIENACEAYCNVVCQAEQKSGKRCYWRVQNERCPELESFVKVMEGEE